MKLLKFPTIKMKLLGLRIFLKGSGAREKEMKLLQFLTINVKLLGLEAREPGRKK